MLRGRRATIGITVTSGGSYRLTKHDVLMTDRFRMDFVWL